MLKTIPPIEALMSQLVKSFDSVLTVSDALAIVASTRRRHVPVRERGKLIGITSERDLLAAEPSQTLGEMSEKGVRAKKGSGYFIFKTWQTRTAARLGLQ